MTVYVDEYGRQSTAPAQAPVQTSMSCTGNCSAIPQPCDVCSRQSAQSYINPAPAPGAYAQDAATVQCDLLKRNYADGCLQGKNASFYGGGGYNTYNTSLATTTGTEIVPCDVTNPKFGDVCLHGRNAHLPQGNVYFDSSNARPYNQAMGGRTSMPASELYGSSPASRTGMPASDLYGGASVGRTSMSASELYGSSPVSRTGVPATEMYQGQNRRVSKQPATDMKPAPGTDWTKYVSVPSAFGDVKTVVVDERGSYLAQNSAPMNQPVQPTRVPASTVSPVQPNAVQAGYIDGFWGLRFGTSQRDAMDYLYSTRRISQNNVITSSEDAVLLENVNMANVNYDNATLMFKDGNITSGLFTKAFGSQSLASDQINKIREDLTQKYGNPKIKGDASSTRYYWHDDVNSRSIMLEMKNPTPGYFGVDLFYVDRGLSRVGNPAQTGSYTNRDY
jgi:hypothetical protein